MITIIVPEWLVWLFIVLCSITTILSISILMLKRKLLKINRQIEQQNQYLT